MWADPPIRGLSTFAFGGLSGILQRTEGVPSSNNNISIQITSSQHKCAWWWTHFLASGPLPVHDGRTWVQGPFSWQWFNIYFPHTPYHGTSPKVESQVSSGHLWSSIGNSTQKRAVSMAVGAPFSLGLEDSAKPGDTSSQASLWVSIPDDAEPDNQTLEEIYAPPSLLVENSGPGAGILPKDVIKPQKEANRVLGCLLATRSSLDAHWRKQVSDCEMALCQNESETTKAINEAKVLCTCTIREAEAHGVTLISEAESSTCHLYQGGQSQLCLHHCRAGGLLLYGYQEGGVTWCQTGQPSKSLWDANDPLPPVHGNMPLATLLNIPPSILHLT